MHCALLRLLRTVFVLETCVAKLALIPVLRGAMITFFISEWREKIVRKIPEKNFHFKEPYCMFPRTVYACNPHANDRKQRIHQRPGVHHSVCDHYRFHFVLELT